MNKSQLQLPLIILFLLINSISALSQSFDFSVSASQGCSPLQVQFQNTTDASIRYNYSYEWKVEPGKFSTETDVVPNTYVEPGKYTVFMYIYNSEKQLIDSVIKQNYITVFRDPDVEITSDKTDNCIYSPFQFSVATEDADAPISQYTWIISDGTSYFGKTPPAHYFTFANTFSVFVAVVDANGCTNRERKEIEVQAYDDFPNPFFTADKKKTCDAQLTVSFTNQTPNQNIESYIWNFGDGTTSLEKNPTHTYIGYGNYNASLTAVSPHGCSETAMQQILLIDYQPDFTITDGIKQIGNGVLACAGEIYFNDATTPIGTTISYEWKFGTSPTVVSNTNSYQKMIPDAGSYFVTLTASNGECTKTVAKSFTVEAPLELSYFPTDTFSCISPAIIKYKAISNLPNTYFEWKIQDSVFVGNNLSIAHAEGIYSDTLYATSPNQCKASIGKKNNVEVAVPSLLISPQMPISGCAPLTVTFNETIVYNTTQDFIKTIEWDFQNDNITDAIGAGPKSFEYTSRGEYVGCIKITTDKGCTYKDCAGDIYTEMIKVGNLPKGDLHMPTEICASTPLSVFFQNLTPSLLTNMFDTIFMIFPHDEINRFPLVQEQRTFPFVSLDIALRDSIGIHNVLFRLSDHGCSTPLIKDSIDLGMGMEPMQVLVKGPLINVEQTPHDCSNPYNYTYMMVETVGLNQQYPKNFDSEYWEWTIQKTHGANKFPPKVFATNVDTVSINFDSDTLGRGIYKIKVIAHNYTTGCVDSSHVLSQITDIIANFSLTDSTPCLHDTAEFVITGGQDIYNSFWIHPFGPIEKAQISTYQDSIFYLFSTKDIKHVTVVSYDIHGCSDTVQKPVKIYQPEAGFFADIVSDCLPFTSQYVDTSYADTTIISRNWSFGNGLSKTGNDSIVTTQYSVMGLTSPFLIVTDVLGCSSQEFKQNYIKPVVPNSIFTIGTPKVCLNHEAILIRNTTNPNYDNNIHKYSWDFGDGSSDSGSLKDTIRHTYTTESDPLHTITLTAYSWSPEGNECVSSYSGQVKVKDVSSKIIIKDSDKCKEPGQKFIVYLDNTIYTSDFKKVDWYKIDGDKKTYIGNKPLLQVVTYDNYGPQQLLLETTTDYHGCELDSTMVEINVPGYEAKIFSDKNQVCVKEEFMFFLKDTINISSYTHYWEFGDGTQNFTDFDGVTHAYTSLPSTENNQYKVQFIVDAPGCKVRPELTKYIQVYPVIADFHRGIDDLDSIGCAPYTVKFTNTSKGSSANIFKWNFGDGTETTEEAPSHTFTSIDAIYQVSLSLQSSICNDKITKPVATHPLSIVSIHIDTMLCVQEKTPIEATGNFANLIWSPQQYFETPTEASTIYTAAKSGYVYAHHTSIHGCKGSDSVFVYVQQYPQYLGAPDSLLLYYFTPDSLKLSSRPDAQIIAGQIYNVNNSPMQGVYYSWNPSTYLSCNDCASPNIDLQCGTPAQPSCIDFPANVQYTVYMTDSLGCFENQRTIEFAIIIDTKAAMPQAFSPNGDGENDFAFVRGWGIKEFLEVKIYNRWGQVIYESNDMYEGWDGYYKGEPQPMDTYAYTIKIINTKNEEEFIKGYITLLR